MRPRAAGGAPAVVVRKSAFVLELTRPDGTTVRFPVAIGSNPDGADKRAEGDCRTPEGEFEVSSVEDSSDWEHDGRRSYGPHFIRLSCPPWTGIGIHGTDEPDTVGTRATLGCVRLRNDDLEVVVGAVAPGTRVRILP
jgi:lipoprotein-anchoring transpeptidase ErfK/SrfK